MKLLLLCFCFYSTTFAASLSSQDPNLTPNCTSNADFDCMPTECREICGCDGYYKFDEAKGDCVVNLEYLKEKTTIKNYISAEKLRLINERVFQGLIGSAIFFIACASICVFSVCIFCIRIHYTDRQLKNEVKALSQKLERVNGKRMVTDKSRRKLLDPINESCNVVVADADIMCV